MYPVLFGMRDEIALLVSACILSTTLYRCGGCSSVPVTMPWYTLYAHDMPISPHYSSVQKEHAYIIIEATEHCMSTVLIEWSHTNL